MALSLRLSDAPQRGASRTRDAGGKIGCCRTTHLPAQSQSTCAVRPPPIEGGREEQSVGGTACSHRVESDEFFLNLKVLSGLQVAVERRGCIGVGLLGIGDSAIRPVLVPGGRSD